MSSEDDEACGTSNIELPDHGVKEYTSGEAFSEPPLVTVNEELQGSIFSVHERFPLAHDRCLIAIGRM